jgi:hypothetical protein
LHPARAQRFLRGRAALVAARDHPRRKAGVGYFRSAEISAESIAPAPLGIAPIASHSNSRTSSFKFLDRAAATDDPDRCLYAARVTVGGKVV